jgi:hypothetical protein
MRWVFTFQEIVEAGGCQAAYRASGIDLHRPYRVMAGAVFLVVEQDEARPQTHAAAILPEQALAALVRQHEAEERPLLKGTAEAFLMGQGLSQRQARAIIRAGNGTRWTLVRLPGGQGKGTPTALYSVRPTE